MAAIPTTGINGRPAAIAPLMTYPQDDQSGGGGLFSAFLCGGADPPFLLCDDSPNEVDFDTNPTGVFVAIHTKQWQLACERVKVYPREVSTWVIRNGLSSESESDAPIGSGSSDRFDETKVTFPRSQAAAEAQKLRWRMLPLHAAVLFGAPADVVKTLINVYPPGCSAHDDQGMLPLHLAFRCGATEEIALILLEAYPEAIERVDSKGRLPSMLASKVTMTYGDSIGEAFIRGPSYYYWASRVATADRVRSETVMSKLIKQLKEDARVSAERGKEMLGKTEKQLSSEIEALSIENNELKERMVWYETKYDGAEEKEKVLVDHTNSLAERLRLTSLSEEHLATKLAKLEAKLQNKGLELEQARRSAAEEKEALVECVDELEKTLGKTKHKAESLTEELEKKIMESNEMKVRFERERQAFEKQVDSSKECLMELIASSKEDKLMYEEDSKELRRQLGVIQSQLEKSSKDERRMYEEDSQQLRQQLSAIQGEVQKAAKASTSRSAAAAAEVTKAESQALGHKMDSLRKEVDKNARSFMSHMNVEVEERNSQFSSTKQLEDRLNNLQEEVAQARSYMGRSHDLDHDEPVMPTGRRVGQQYLPLEPVDAEPVSPQYSYSSKRSTAHSLSERSRPKGGSIHSSSGRTSFRSSRGKPKLNTPRHIDEDVDPFDEYVSTKSSKNSDGDQSRDDTECFSHLSDVDTAMALGELSEDQRLALEQLDLSGSKDEIASMLGRVPGLTMNQVTLLVDVASSLAA